MDDKTLSDSEGIELDAELIARMLEEGDRYSSHTADLAEFIHKNKTRFRDQLLADGSICAIDPQIEGFTLAAVDGASAVENHGGGALVIVVAQYG
jgi:hypothetical protein